MIKLNKNKHILLLILSITLIFSAILTGCAPEGALYRIRGNDGTFARPADSSKTAGHIEDRVINLSLKINSVPNYKINRIEHAVNLKDKDSEILNYKKNYKKYIDVGKILLQKKIYEKAKKNCRKTIMINHTVFLSSYRKVKLIVKSIEIGKIFYILNFSVFNLSKNKTRFDLSLLKKTAKGFNFDKIKFKSNLKKKFDLKGESEVEGELIFAARQSTAGIAFVVNAINKSGRYRLVYK